MDLIIDLYKKDVDMTLIDENLKLSHQERFDKFIKVIRFLEKIKGNGNDV